MAPLTLLFRQLETQQLNGDGKPKTKSINYIPYKLFFLYGLYRTQVGNGCHEFVDTFRSYTEYDIPACGFLKSYPGMTR